MIYVHQIEVQNETNKFKQSKGHCQNFIWKITSITILDYEMLNISNVIPSYNIDNCEYNAQNSLIQVDMAWAMFLFLGYAQENQTKIPFRLGYN